MNSEPEDNNLGETRPHKVLSPGSEISHYRIVKQIGAGGMGVVYRAEDTKLKRQVALKFLPPHLTQNPEAKKRFVHEAQSASAMDHSNICTIYEVDETGDGQMFISMACYEGETLRTRLGRGTLAEDEVLEIATQTASGLAEAHKKGIVHRDIKPANLIMTLQGQVKIMDFGLAKLAGQTRLTKTGAAMGTVAYMSPEQARGENVDQQSDVWSLGVVLYEMLTGKLPFKGDYEQAMIYSILNEEPMPIGELRPGTSTDLELIISKALRKDPRERYDSAETLLADLRRLRTSESISVSPSRRRPFPGRLLVVAAALCVVIITVVLGPRLARWFAPTQAEATTLAVVDFENIDGEDADYLAVGLAEGICVKLSKVEGIQVVSSDDIRRLRQNNLPAKEIAERLGAEFAVGGSLLKSGDKIRVTPQLIEASTGRVVWSEFFDREFGDVFGFMDEVSLKIVDALKIEFTQEERLAIGERSTDNPQAYDHYLRGRHHFHRETVADNELAAKEYRKALRIDLDYPLALAGLADAYVQRYRERYDYDEYWLDQADSLINKALESEPDLAEAYKSRAAVLLEKENLLAALEAAEKARSLSPEWDEPYVQLGDINRERGEASLALEMYQQALAIRPSVRAWCGKGDVLYMRGQVDSALALYRVALEHSPHNEYPYYELGWHYWDLGREEEADSMLRLAIEIRPDHSLSYLELSWLLYTEGRMQEARDLVRGFVDKYPYNWEAYERLYGIVAWGIGDWVAGMAIVEEAVARNPDRVWPYLLLASSHAWEMSGSANKEQARAALDKALALRPGSSRVLAQAARVYGDMKEMDTSLEYYRQALKQNPGGLGILCGLAERYFHAGLHEEAAETALKAREQAPGVLRDTEPNSYRILGRVMPILGRTEEYFEILKSAAATYGPDNLEFYSRLGVEQCRRGEFADAKLSFERALEIREDQSALMGLGSVHWFLGDLDAAMSSYRRAREVVTRAIIDERIIALLKYQGKFDEVEEHLEAIRASGNLDMWFWRSVYYYASMHRYDEAIALAKEMRKDPGVTYGDEVLWDMGLWNRKGGNFSEALKVLDEAQATLPPAYYHALDYQRTRIAAAQGRLDDAIELARSAADAEAGPLQDSFHTLLAKLFIAAGRQEEGADVLNRIKRTSEIHWLEASYTLVQLEEMSGSSDGVEEARETLFLATRAAYHPWFWPAFIADTRCFCALASARLGDERRAREEIEFALRLEPERADVAYWAAAAYSLTGDTDMALDWLETTVERDHGDVWWAQVDPDLDGLRDLPRFQQIMSDWDYRLKALP
jgi:non-specific serine/threonine protein kinase